MDRQAPRGTWDFRRAMSIRVLQFCAATVAVSVLLSGVLNADVAKTAVMSAFTLAGAVVATYLGTAVTHDYVNRPRPPTEPIAKPPVLAKDDAIG